jgi:hypothetical protein
VHEEAPAGKHFLNNPKYQIDQHYDDDHGYNDTDGAPRHPHLLPFSPSFAPTNTQKNSARAGAPEDPGPITREPGPGKEGSNVTGPATQSDKRRGRSCYTPARSEPTARLVGRLHHPRHESASEPLELLVGEVEDLVEMMAEADPRPPTSENLSSTYFVNKARRRPGPLYGPGSLVLRSAR